MLQWPDTTFLAEFYLKPEKNNIVSKENERCSMHKGGENIFITITTE